MAENLFLGLPPPSSSSSSAHPPTSRAEEEEPPKKKETPPAPVPILKSALKSSLKRSKPNESQAEVVPAAPQKRAKFKTIEDTSETQVIEAMQKIASHISNPSKFSKATKLAIQLIQAGSVKPGTSDHFFAILETAMSSTTVSTNPSLRADYHALFSAAQDVVDCFSKNQRNQLTTWTITAVVGNDLYTDDSFVFSKAASRIKDIITSLPAATENEDMEEAAALKEEKRVADAEAQEQDNMQSDASVQPNKVEFDPFGLDALLPGSKTDERSRKKEAATLSKKAEEEESKRFLKSQREAVIFCLEIAARRYRVPWCQTVIDILVKHAFDHKARFTAQQRDAIGKLWASILEQQTRRKQGKSVTGKLDMNGFEWLQEKYASEKISIRRAVGGGGDRKAQQWLG